MSLLAATGIDQSPLIRTDAAPGTRTLRRRVYEVLERAEPGDRLSALVDVFLIGLIILSATAIILESIASIYVV